MAGSTLLTLLFAAGVAFIYYLIPSRFRWVVLLVASAVFYVSAQPLLFMLLVAEAVWTWFASTKIEGARHPKRWLVAGIVPAVLCLFVFKYLNFFCDSVTSFLNSLGLAVDPFTIQLMMPLGISYYTFKCISSLADVYTQKIQTNRHLGHFLAYVLFFPQILCGPIQRASDFLPQIKEPAFDKMLCLQGFQLFIRGLFKKIVIANQLLPYVDQVYANYAAYSGLALFMSAFFYSVLIYCDFSGYSDIAIGMSNIFGLRCPQNFNAPYFARNIRDFWNRWHISLSSWLRDYIYIPLGGSRCSNRRRIYNLMVTFLVSGLWHGASWSFVAWGGIHGIWNALTPRTNKRRALQVDLLPKAISMDAEMAKQGALSARVELQPIEPIVKNVPITLRNENGLDDHELTKQGDVIKQNANLLRRSWADRLKLIIYTLLTFSGVSVAWIFFRAPDLSVGAHYIWRMITKFSLSIASIEQMLLVFRGDSTSVTLFLTIMLMILMLAVYEWRRVYIKDRKLLSVPWMVFMLVSILLFGSFGASKFLYANF